MPLFEEFIRAVSILEEYGQTEDALWYVRIWNIHFLGL